MSKHIVIIGAGYAGMLAAMRISHRTRRDDTIRVTLINAAAHFVERTRLHTDAAGEGPRRRALTAMLRGTGIDFVQGRVTHIEPDAQRVTVQTASGPQTLAYTTLVYALGSMIDTRRIPGETAYTLNDGSAQALAERLPQIAQQGGTITVIGAGLTGIEAATRFAHRYPGLHVRVTTSGRLGDDLSEGAARYLRQVFGDYGIELIENTRVTRIEADGVQLANGDTLPTDAALLTAGFTVPTLAKDSGITVNGLGQILVDDTMRSISHPSIYAAGDSAAFASETGMPTLRMSCQVAQPMGAYVGSAVVAELNGQQPQPFDFGYLARCIDVGGGRALVQFVRLDDTPKAFIITGRLGGWVKELILRGTIWAIYVERLLDSPYRWAKHLRARRPDQHDMPILER